MWRTRTCASLLSFKRRQASPIDGRLAKAITDPHRLQHNFFVLPSINSIYSVNGYIGDTPVNFLVDSGAALSVIHYNLVRDMQLTQTSHCAVGANGSPLDIVGQVMVTIALGTFVIAHTFVVVHNLTVDCLLGADFMKNHAAVLDCEHNTLTLGRDSKFTFPLAAKQQPALCKASCGVHLVRSSQDVEIPARSVQLIAGTIDSRGTGAMVMLVEPVETLPHQLHVARSLSSCCNNQVTIQVLNVSPSPVTVYRGMSLGRMTPGDDALLV